MQVVNVKKSELNKRGIKDFQEWLKRDNTIYIGRDMSVYVANANASKWQNPYTVKKYGRAKCLELYEDYIRNSHLISELPELIGMELGCWCVPQPCHGNILIKLIQESNRSEV